MVLNLWRSARPQFDPRSTSRAQTDIPAVSVQLSHQSKVREYADGRPTYVPYVKSQQYAEDVLEAVCNSSLVARLTRLVT